MSTKVKVVIVVVALAGSFAAGRYLAPQKIKIETKTVEVIKTVIQKEKAVQKDTHKETTITETTKPDGTKETKTVVVEDNKIKKDTTTVKHEDTTTNTDTKKEIVKTTSRLNISALAGVPISLQGLGSFTVGAHVSKDLIGPVSFGVWGLSSGTVGISAGLTF